MIAFSRNDSDCAGTIREPSFEELLPAIQQQARRAFRSLPFGEREEMVAETIANAFCAFHRLVQRGKADLAYATPLAQFAIRQVRAGRRVGAKLNVRDVSSPYCQRAKQVKLSRLHRYEQKEGVWKEIVVEDKTATPADIAACRVDFACWLRTLSNRSRKIALTLATGEATAAVAGKYRVSAARISQLRRELQDAWLAFHGELAAA